MLRLFWFLVVLLTPLLGTWFASSLAASHGAPVWLAAASGLLLFPVLPVAWELRSAVRRAKAGSRTPRRLRLWDRLTLRTLGLNLAFLAAVLALAPRPLFTALSTRGDWMLPPGGDGRVALARRALFTTADAVEWAYVLARRDPYADQLVAGRVPRPELSPPGGGHPPPPAPRNGEAPSAERPAPPPVRPGPEAPVAPGPDAGVPGPKPDDDGALAVLRWKDSGPRHFPPPPDLTHRERPPEPIPPRPAGGARDAADGAPWPFEPTPHPLVAELPRSMETDIASVAQYIARHEGDPFQRIKALHDYVADRVAYDVPSYRSGVFPPQSAEEVFRSRKAVCAGYTNLFVALGQAAGAEIVAVAGDARGGLKPEPEPHAWSAARIEGRWYLIDVTWDAGYVEGDAFIKRYGTAYLLTPPELFSMRHFPNDPAWQLLPSPISRGEFLRQPLLEPAVFAAAASPTPGAMEPERERRAYEAGIRILEPDRSQIEARGRFRVRLENPRQLRARVSLLNPQDGRTEDCASDSGDTLFECTVRAPGLFTVQVFAGPPSERVLQRVGQFEVTST